MKGILTERNINLKYGQITKNRENERIKNGSVT